jgi:hypothetical protein
MRIRYMSYILLGVLAAFLVVATQVFPLAAVQSIALGVGVAMLCVSLSIAGESRRIPGRIMNDAASLGVGVLSAAVSAWIVVETQVFSLSTMQDVTFYSGILAGALALAGLTAHELRVERVVHSLEVRSGEAKPQPVGDGQPLAA